MSNPHALTSSAAAPPGPRPDGRSHVLFLVLAGVLWGTGGITGRLLADMTGLAAPAVAAYRLGLGGVVLVVISLLSGERLPRSATGWRHIVAIGLLAAVFQAAYFSAVQVASVSLATLVAIGTAPLVVLVVERIGGRRHSARRLFAAGGGVVGLALLVGAPGSGGSGSHTLLGAALALVSGTAFAGFTLAGRNAPRELNPQLTVGSAFLVGGGSLAVVATATVGMGFPVTARAIWLLAVLALVPTAAAYACYAHGLRGAPASTAVVIALLEPTTATLLSVAFLGERLTELGLVGAVLLLASVAYTARLERRGLPAPG